MDEKELRQRLLNGKKTERIIFAVTPELKEVISAVAKDQCISVSGLLTTLAVKEINTSGDIANEALSHLDAKSQSSNESN
ncbi:MAG TPA: hypothetical protein OIM20_06565 [Eggerthellaceae bacterium]|nr:hypothetical protein [Eggerthellaceae bacterium]